MSGYIPRRTKDVVADWEVPEGSEPFRATIITSLSFAEIDAIPLDGSASYGQLFQVIAPYVVAWNAMGRNAETGAYEPLPPPAEAGPDVLRLVEPMITMFLAIKLKRVHLGDEAERPKGSTPSGTTPSGEPAPS
jgi:hypothetical protein